MNGDILSVHKISIKITKPISYGIILLILIVIILLGYFILIITQEPCKDDRWPIPPPASIEFGPYYLVTDQGPLYIGQTYKHRNEGPWVGNMTLLFIENKGAILLFQYPKGTKSNFKVLTCRGYLPRNNDKDAGK